MATALDKIKSALPVRMRNYFFPITTDVVNPTVAPYMSPDPKNLTSYIMPVQLQRIRQDVLNWRQGISEAEQVYFPYRVKMMRLFYDTILNGHVQACMEKRKNLTLLRGFRMVDAAGNENEELTKLLKKQWFFDFLSYTIDAKFFGYSLIQLGDVKNSEISEITIIRRHNISPDRMNVAPFIYSISGTPFLQEPYDAWCVWIPTPSDIGVSNCGYGLLYKIGIYEIMCRNLLGFNGDYVEIYGQPFRVAKSTKSQESPERAALEQMIAQMGSNGWAVIDDADSIEFVESSRAGSAWQTYENLEKRCEQKISKVLLGHADALDSVPGKLGSGQGADTSPTAKALEEIQTSDGRFCENVINSKLLPKLKNIGVRFPDGYRFEFSNDDELVEARQNEDANNKVTADIVSSLSTAGFDVDEKYITDRTGIPVKKKEVPAPLQPGDTKFSNDVMNKLRSIYA